jgi:hypothetical protein
MALATIDGLGEIVSSILGDQIPPALTEPGWLTVIGMLSVCRLLLL